jgi:hypothetical protein
MPLVTKTFSEIITFTRASSGTYFDATGTLQTATTDAARFDYNPSTLAARGFLVEEQRTNLALRSQELENAYWTKGGLTVAADQEIAPDGTLSGDTITITASGHAIYRYLTVTASTAYTLSFFVKKGTATNAAYSITDDSAGGTNIIAPTSYFSQIASSGWTRISVSFTTPVGCTSVGVFLLRDSGVSSGTISIWGAQLEAGAFPTSYIATTTASATRSADVASVNTLSPWYNASEGTIYAEAVRSNIPVSTNGNVVDISDGTTNNRARLWIWSGNASQIAFTVASGGSGVADLNPGAVTASTVFKVAGAYKVNDFATSINGGTVATDASGAVPVSPNIVNLGARSGGSSEFWNGHLRRITYYPRRLSNSELQGITT